jgi:STE24 endopeptidase
MQNTHSQHELDPQRQTRAKEYARINRRLMLVNWLWTALYAVLWLLLGWAAGLQTWLQTITNNPWLMVAFFAAIFGAIDALITAPLSFYSGFILPHRYDLTDQSLKDWLLDNLKGFLIGGPIGLLVLELIYLFLRNFPQTWWLWTAGFMLLFSVVIGRLAPVLILPIFNKYIPLEEEHADLAERLVQLAQRAGTRVQGVFRFDMSRQTKAANAGLTGIGGSRRIVLGDTLLDNFEPDEIETILAHELGHQVNRDIPIGMLVSTVMTLGGLFLASLALGVGVRALGFSGVSAVAAMPLLGLVMAAYGLLTMPLSNAYSRWREVKADRYALELTGNAEAYIAAMTRLANQNLADVDPEPWVVFLLHSHPPIHQRIAMAQAHMQQSELETE